MTYEITWELRATNAAVRFLAEDPQGLREVYEAVDALAIEPRPRGSVPYGSSGVRRLRIGDYRILYVIDGNLIRILVTHLGRTP